MSTDPTMAEIGQQVTALRLRVEERGEVVWWLRVVVWLLGAQVALTFAILLRS